MKYINENIAPVIGAKFLPVSEVTLNIAVSCSDVISTSEKTPSLFRSKAFNSVSSLCSINKTLIKHLISY